MNLGAFMVGMVLFPKRLYRAFMRGRRCVNLYREGFPESELATKSVSWLRDRCGIGRGDSRASMSDKLAFGFWCFVAIAYHAAWFALGLAILWWLAIRML